MYSEPTRICGAIWLACITDTITSCSTLWSSSLASSNPLTNSAAKFSRPALSVGRYQTPVLMCKDTNEKGGKNQSHYSTPHIKQPGLLVRLPAQQQASTFVQAASLFIRKKYAPICKKFAPEAIPCHARGKILELFETAACF